MSAKLYREIIEFLKNQREVLKSFENEREYIINNNSNIGKLFESLKYNLNLLEKNINNCLDEDSD